MRMSLLLVPFLLAFLQAAVSQQGGGSTSASSLAVAATPPMGWNSWNYFAGRVNDADVRAAADAMVSSGMRDAGYTYINIDDTWEGQRDAQGFIQSNSKFPDMAALAAYVHSKGLKLGIYSSPGPRTCAGYPGSYGHVQQDADTYAKWGIDYVKYDLCSFNGVMKKEAPDDPAQQMRLMEAAYAKMHQALQHTGRPIVFSLCQYGMDAVWEWAPSVGGNLWRTTGDINPRWDRIYDILSQQAGLAKYAGPGHWNDPDMLEVGNGNLTMAENRAHFSMWAMLAAPLLAGNDLAQMNPAIVSILTNRDVIAIDQDRLGQQAARAYTDGEVEVWTRRLSGGALAIAVLNAGSNRYSTHPFHLDLERLHLRGPQQAKDLWTGKEMTLSQNMPLEIGSHDILLVRIASPHSMR
ncbi:MAG: glycoside hydrolase family 27 protein [Acidobacteriaceae bacterium]